MHLGRPTTCPPTPAGYHERLALLRHCIGVVYRDARGGAVFYGGECGLIQGDEWHLVSQAARPHHPPALPQIAATKAATGDVAGADVARWMAFHYEAHGCHSLTDLWAPGHSENGVLGGGGSEGFRARRGWKRHAVCVCACVNSMCV